MTATSRWSFMLAVGATGTALSLSILAGWQRGGSLPERIAWIAIGMVLVTSAHLLPALLRDAPILVRGTGSLLWVACLTTACYGHGMFFLLAQQHAGEIRAATLTTVGVPTSGRSLVAVMRDRANVTRQLAFTQTQRCSRDCPGLQARQATLSAKLDALDAEANDVQRRLAADDRVTAQRDALLADPVTSRLAALLGVTVARVDLLSGLAFASVLECVACLLWTIALRPSPAPAGLRTVTLPQVTPPSEPVTEVTRVPQPAATTVTAADKATHRSKTVSSETVTDSHAAPGDPVAPPTVTASDDEIVTHLALEVAVGLLRPTVAGIRRHLSCSQERAATLRRQLAKHKTA
ncbi:hypothetical protein [Pararobbsia alpina]|uniref:Uncharacterized protein n=1 Tax=Pararobbsia alpina TaxID=621374 RepID=A0A6S7C3L6_9BURK|nr:hypothetical protein [Pararobbsia alpina]CAB3800611.1 hypothetical protein LMG28138_04864 [Pararobbsia alpina]